MAYTLAELFAAARVNPGNPMNRPGRLTGRHCVARLQRGQAKRVASGKRPFHPAFGHRVAVQPEAQQEQRA